MHTLHQHKRVVARRSVLLLAVFALLCVALSAPTEVAAATKKPQKKVTGLEVSSVKKRAATLTWNSRKRATYYKVQLRTGGEVVHAWKKHKKITRKIKRKHNKLQSGTTYWFRVKACNGKGCSRWSKKKRFETDPASDYEAVPDSLHSELLSIEIHNKINDYRESIGLNSLLPHSGMEEIAEEHSTNMANGSVEFGHDGFDERFEAMLLLIGSGSGAENVAYATGYPVEEMADIIVDGWLNSEGHRHNIEGSSYYYGGVGTAEEDGFYYFTHLFFTE